jgi:hypothetical protein
MISISQWNGRAIDHKAGLVDLGGVEGLGITDFFICAFGSILG